MKKCVCKALHSSVRKWRMCMLHTGAHAHTLYLCAQHARTGSTQHASSIRKGHHNCYCEQGNRCGLFWHSAYSLVNKATIDDVGKMATRATQKRQAPQLIVAAHQINNQVKWISLSGLKAAHQSVHRRQRQCMQHEVTRKQSYRGGRMGPRSTGGSGSSVLVRAEHEVSVVAGNSARQDTMCPNTSPLCLSYDINLPLTALPCNQLHGLRPTLA